MGNTDYYVDGGILCNFPIQACDGKIILFFNPNCPWIKIWPGLHCFELNSYLQIYHALSSYDFFYSQFPFLGWYLSMRNEDAFINRMQPLADIERLLQRKERFGTRNEKTLGFLVVMYSPFIKGFFCCCWYDSKLTINCLGLYNKSSSQINLAVYYRCSFHTLLDPFPNNLGQPRLCLKAVSVFGDRVSCDCSRVARSLEDQQS